ncbi:MAG TPA: TolC family protein [Polyangiaceae bacterium]
MTELGRRLASVGLGAALLSGCVAHDIGSGDVQSAIEERTGHRVRWNHVESDQPGDSVTQKLLGQPLSADAAAQVALLNAPEAQAAFEELGVSRAELVGAFHLPNPSAEAAVRFGESTPEVELGVMLDLTDLVLLPWRKQQAEGAHQAAQARVAGRLLDVVFSTKRAFFEYQAAERRVQMRQSLVQAADAARALAERLREAGNIPQLSVMVERARYDEARLELARAEAASTAARERLNQHMGVWGHGTHWRAAALAEPEAALENLADVEQRALKASLDLQVAQHDYAALARRANLATVEGLLPELKAGVSAERQENEWGVGPAVELELPVFYQGQGEVARAEAEMRRVQSQHRSLAVRVRAAVRAASRNLVVARDAALHYRDRLLPERARIVEETQLMYNAMSVGAFELLQAKRDQVQTETAYVDTLEDYWIAKAELEQLLLGRLVGVAPLEASAAGPAPASADAH